jgi:hypothetical protein
MEKGSSGSSVRVRASAPKSTANRPLMLSVRPTDHAVRVREPLPRATRRSPGARPSRQTCRSRRESGVLVSRGCASDPGPSEFTLSGPPPPGPGRMRVSQVLEPDLGLLLRQARLGADPGRGRVGVHRALSRSRVRNGYVSLGTRGHARPRFEPGNRPDSSENVPACARTCPRVPYSSFSRNEGVPGSSPGVGF